MSGRPWALSLLSQVDVNVSRALETLEGVKVTGPALVTLNGVLAQLEAAADASRQLHDRLTNQDPSAAGVKYAHRVVSDEDDD